MICYFYDNCLVHQASSIDDVCLYQYWLYFVEGQIAQCPDLDLLIIDLKYFEMNQTIDI